MDKQTIRKWIDTTQLPDIHQRACPIETIGQVIGTNGTAPYVHLQLEMSKRLFGSTMPTLVANDGDGEKAEEVRKIAAMYGAEYIGWPALGHALGDLKIFQESMKWATRIGIDVVAKFSRRFVPLIHWRHGLQYLLAMNPDQAFFTRRHEDAEHGLFRTDAIAFRNRLINTKRVHDTIDETINTQRKNVNVEVMFDSFQQVCGGWVKWDLLGPHFYKPWTNAMQWRGLLPYHYGDLSRSLGLPYDDIHFVSASAINIVFEGDKPPSLADQLSELRPPVEEPGEKFPYTVPEHVMVIQTEPGPLTVKPETPLPEPTGEAKAVMYDG